MRTLVSLGYLRQLPSRRYALGPGLVWLGDRAGQLLATWARPALEGLEHSVRESANLAILDGDPATYVAQVPSRMFTEVGRRVLPHAAGVGKAILAQFQDDEVKLGLVDEERRTSANLKASIAEATDRTTGCARRRPPSPRH